MNTTKLNSIKMALMTAQSDINEENKADYIMRVSGEFKITPDFYDGLLEEEKESLTEGLITSMFSELSKEIKNEDTVGLWIDYDGEVFENSIKISTLGDMKNLGAEDIEPIYEFFKMTLTE